MKNRLIRQFVNPLRALTPVLCCLAVTSQATLVLTPLGSGAPGADVALDPLAAVVAGPLVSPFAYGGAFSGTLTSTVLQESALNNPLGGYTFLYVIANAGSSADALRRFTIDDWKTDLNVVVGNTIAAGIDAPIADRSANGDIIGFDWGVVTPITAGGFGEVFVRTSLQGFTIANGSTIDSGTATVQTYAAAAVPEPATLMAGMLLLLPFGASTLRILRNRRAA
jgi:hypothetical protein